MNNALAHTGSSFPTLALKSDGGILILTSGDPYDGDEEVTRTDIRVPSEPDTDSDGWVDGMTIFALILTFIGFCGMIAQDVGEKAAARHEARVRLDQNCMLTYK